MSNEYEQGGIECYLWDIGLTSHESNTEQTNDNNMQVQMALASLLCKNNKYHHDATVKFIASCRQTCMLFENLAHKMCGNQKGIWTESFHYIRKIP
jgi:hypothetical protein